MSSTSYRCHFLLLELYCDMSSLVNNDIIERQSFVPNRMSPYGNERSNSPPNLSMQNYSTPSLLISKYSNPIPFSTLTSYGVIAETVRQLSDMKTYLSRHVSLYNAKLSLIQADRRRSLTCLVRTGSIDFP